MTYLEYHAHRAQALATQTHAANYYLLDPHEQDAINDAVATEYFDAEYDAYVDAIHYERTNHEHTELVRL
jgi:hypothetical protein